MAFPDTQDFFFFFSTASPEWLRTGPEGMSGDSRHFADPPELPWHAEYAAAVNACKVHGGCKCMQGTRRL